MHAPCPGSTGMKILGLLKATSAISCAPEIALMKKEWFANWFDSPYYHILYKNHDDSDAQRALDNLLTTLNLKPGARVLDLACGKGRHSRHLASKGFDVTGLDISTASIVHARQFEQPGLAFYQHDMRLPFRINYYDAILNMFTSFGYFDNEHDHIKTLLNIQKGLKPGGCLLLDYFNADQVRKNLERHFEKTVDGIHFSIKKTIRKGHIYKTVAFTDSGRNYQFRERVRLFTLDDFRHLFALAGLQIEASFGDYYHLTPFDPAQSPRLIMIVRKV